MATVRPRNIDGRIQCPPGYELVDDGLGGVCQPLPGTEAAEGEVPEWQKDTEAGQRAYRERFYNPESPHHVPLLPMPKTDEGGDGKAGADTAGVAGAPKDNEGEGASSDDKADKITPDAPQGDNDADDDDSDAE